MQRITLRVISGADRGRVYRELAMPITIGREEGNMVQLNDERISRYHVKIQEDDNRLVITDLDSTNGTRVNGHVCSLKILRYGDTISIGRTVLLVGTREQVADWFDSNRDLLTSNSSRSPMGVEDDGDEGPDFDMSTGLAIPKMAHSSSHDAQIPHGMSPGQSAELRELLDILHAGMRAVVDVASVDEKESLVTIDIRAWQKFLMTQSELSEMIRGIEDPQGSDASSRQS
ncbi:MAG: FHA domain-containing protein [Planctomycetales bacterium]|nr:FHA domain-containing protein [Planctomycetales bacterium]